MERPARGSDYEILDERFAGLVQSSARVDLLYEGTRWAEGPVYVPAGRYLVWSDIPNDRMLRWDEPTGHVGPFRQPAGYTNGHTLDGQGRLVSCEHGGRRVTRTEHDGSITVLAVRFEGRRLNSPNDVVVHSDGSIWFTDPSYGIDTDYEGHRGPRELDGCYVFRLDPATGDLRVVVESMVRPNGLAFSLDERLLYVSDTGRADGADGPPNMRVFAVADDGTLDAGRLFAVPTNGSFDGFRLDEAGRIWTSAGDGVHCYDPDGTLLGKVLVPEAVANVVFGGPKRNRLFIAATTSLYAVYVRVRGA